MSLSRQMSNGPWDHCLFLNFSFRIKRMKTLFTRPGMIAIVLVYFVFLVVNSCGPKSIDKISDAQNCLNHAAANEVDDCLSKIDGVDSTAAYELRCAGAFIKEGFLDPNVFVDSLNSLTSGGVTATTFVNVLGLITFNNESSISSNNSNASAAFNNCYLSGGKATTFLSSFGYLSTALALYGSLNGVAYNNGDSASTLGTKLATALAAAIADTTDATPGKANLETAIGSIVISTYQISCTGSVQISESMCTKFKTAISSAVPAGSARSTGDSFIGNL